MILIYRNRTQDLFIDVFVQSCTGLVKKAIMESGFTMATWAVSLPTTTPTPLSHAQAVAAKVGCPTDRGTSALVSCLRGQPLDTLITAAASIRVRTKPYFSLQI